MKNTWMRRTGAVGTAPKLAVRGVGVTRGGVRVLEGVDLEVDPGTFVALIGPSGADKSTLLGLLAGLEAPDEGTVLLDGAPLAGAGSVGYDLRLALTSGRVDAVVDAYWNIEAVELAQEGFETNVIKLPEGGVPNYNELVVATSDRYAREEPETVRRFVGALAKGQAYAAEHPESAGDALINANEQLDTKVVEETLRLTAPSSWRRGSRSATRTPRSGRSTWTGPSRTRFFPGPWRWRSQ